MAMTQLEHPAGTEMPLGDAVALIAAAQSAQRAERLLQVRQLELAAAFADCYGYVEESFLPGAERLRETPDGVPDLAEFAVPEYAAAMGMTCAQAWLLLRDALTMRHRFPVCWQRLREGRLDVWRARKVLAETHRLSAVDVAQLDDRLADALETRPLGRVMRLVRGMVAALTLTEERARHYVVVSRDGRTVGAVHGVLPVREAEGLDRCLDEMAAALAEAGDTRSLDDRRAAALGMLAHPERAAALLSGQPATAPRRRETTLVVHVDGETLAEWAAGMGSGVARCDRLGPLTLADLRRTLGAEHVTIRPLLDPRELRPSDAYETPGRLAELVCFTSPADWSPFSELPSRLADLDHTEPYRWDATIRSGQHDADSAPPSSPPLPRRRGPAEPGQTRLGNIAPVRRLHHRAKTHGGWRSEAHPDGIVWTTPLGYRYLVGPDGTRQLTRRPRADEARLGLVVPAWADAPRE